MPLAVFDMDGVLSQRDTMAQFLRELVLERPGKVAAALPVLAVRKLGSRSIGVEGRTSRAMVRVAARGLSADEFDRRAGASGARQATRPGWVMETGIERLRRHLENGDRVVVTTGTEEHVAEAFLTGAGVPLGPGGALLLASGYQDAAGRSRYRHNFAAGKLVSAALAGLDVEQAVFYTDSLADLPVARRARRVILIDPDRRTASVFQREVADLSIEFWR